MSTTEVVRIAFRGTGFCEARLALDETSLVYAWLDDGGDRFVTGVCNVSDWRVRSIT